MQIHWNINIHLHNAGVRKEYEEILRNLKLLLTEDKKMSKKIDDLVAADQSLETEIDAAIAHIESGDLSPADAAKVDKLILSMTTKRDQLHAADNPPPTTTTPPVINSVFPVTGPTGTLVTISGVGFGDTQGASTVSLNGSPVSPASWSDSTITVTVTQPVGNVDIVVNEGGDDSNKVSFTVV